MERLRAAQERGYVPDRAARMMRGASSGTMGLVVPDISNAFYATTAHHLAAELADQALHLVPGETADDLDREVAQLRGLAGSRVAAAIVVPTATPDPAPTAEPPTAVVCASVQNSRGVVDEVLRQMAQVPAVRSLIGSDDAGSSWWGSGLATELVVRGSTSPPQTVRPATATPAAPIPPMEKR